ncbi:MAG: hypothetical protein HYU41_03790 [Candidatus Rokubacteria bacterium]|nr:hypothetical protein [Candidatus Rokubacteria bacterium]
MKTFFFMGRNPKNKSGVSWKIWKIQRQGRTVTVFWAPAVLKKRRVRTAGKLHIKKITRSSVADAIVFERTRVQSKLRKGYQRRPRRR